MKPLPARTPVLALLTVILGVAVPATATAASSLTGALRLAPGPAPAAAVRRCLVELQDALLEGAA